MRRAFSAALAASALTLTLGAAPAAAQVDPQVVQVVTAKACGSVTVILTNNDVSDYSFVFSQVAFNGGNVGRVIGVIDVPKGGVPVTQIISFEEDSFGGQGAFTLVVNSGPNTFKQPVVDLGLVDTDCLPPVTTTPTTTPTVTPTTTPTVTPTTTPTVTPSFTLSPEPSEDDDDVEVDDSVTVIPNDAPDTGGGPVGFLIGR